MSVRDQLQGAVTALVEACDDAARHVAAPDVAVFRSYLEARNKRMWELVEVVKDNCELFAAAEDTAAQLSTVTRERNELRNAIRAACANLDGAQHLRHVDEIAGILRTVLSIQCGDEISPKGGAA